MWCSLLTNLLMYGYYYRYAQYRKDIRTILESENYAEAKTKLDAVVAEHNTKYPFDFVKERLDFNYGESIILRHAKRHLDRIIEDNFNAPFHDENGNLIHQSDKVIHAISVIPKPDYHYHGS